MAHAQSVDSFNPGANGTVYSLAVQPDGKILVGRDDVLLYDPATGNWRQYRNLALGGFVSNAGTWDVGLTVVTGR